jgi:hypothetical protein
MTAIDAWMSADMQAAIRLTREGHVAEATALLQRLFHGKRQSGSRLKAWTGPSVTDTSPPSIRHASRVFDVDPTTGAVKSANDSISIASGTQAAPPIPRTSEKFRGFLDQSTGRQGSSSTQWRVLARRYRAARGSRRPFMRALMGAAPTSCMSQVDFMRANLFHSSSCYTDALSRPTILRPAHG